ncbi:MAG: sigma 54-interacting transcriptional regulator [Polyangiaceae bacterium]
MEAARKLTPVALSEDGLLAQPLVPAPGSSNPLERLAESLEEVSFAAFDAALAQALGAPGVVLLRVPADSVESAALHVQRRAIAALGEEAVTFDSSATSESPWREAGRRLSSCAEPDLPRLGAAVSSVRDVADILLAVPVRRCVVVADRGGSAFGRGVLEILSSGDGPTGALVIAVTSTEVSAPRVGDLAGPTGRGILAVTLTEQLDAADAEAWWSSVARRAPEASLGASLADLEYWWAVAAMGRSTSASRATPPALGGAAERLLCRLLLANRACSIASLALAPADAESALDELRARGLVHSVHAGSARAIHGLAPRAAVLREALAARADAADRAAVVSMLRALRSDADASLRVVELCEDRSPEDDHRALAALQKTVDAESREDLWRRFDRALTSRWLGDSSRADEPATPTPWVGAVVEILNHATDVALSVGDSERAMSFAQRARRSVLLLPADAGASVSEADVLLQLGRAEVATGDLTSASLTVGRAISAAEAVGAQDLVLRGRVELAEVQYTLGRLEDAKELAEACSVAHPSEPTKTSGRPRSSLATVRLAARNVLGKVLLARSRFVEAEAHFAADASDAACLGDTTSELRARLNRGIALMSIARYAEARAMLEVVHRVGDERGELRAVSFALGNLATIAVLEHRYAEALALLERTIDLLRRVGDKPRLAIFVTNLAELRLRLGLDKEAEQLLLFGRRVCGISSPRLAQFALVSARIQLAKGRTGAAFRELNGALAPAGLSLSPAGALVGSPNRGWSGSAGGLVAEALRVAARAALEDGDAGKAARLIEAASKEPASARTDAELAILRALVARARGEAFAELAAEASEKARTADDDELRIESNLVCYWATSDARFLDAARVHRSGIADALPEWLRARYLQRTDLAVLEAELERAADARKQLLTSVDAGPVSIAPPTLRDCPPSSQPASSQPASSQPLVGTAKKRRFVGNDPSVRALLNAIKKIGPSDATVLIHGESGTGKELVADAIHEASARASQPLVKVNCAALVETLLLSELFGHEKGAFTGAATRRKGRFEAAEGGTLFLDEIGDISHRTQVALLRVLQEKTFERVGGTSPIQANVRIVCASHKDLKSLVAAGQFREDLYYRLCGVLLDVPSLRSRLDDLPELAEALLDRISKERGVAAKKLSAHARAALRMHSWPGNVRELENALRAASLFAEGDEIEVEDFALNVESLKFLAAPASIPGVVTFPPSKDGANSGAAVAASPSVVPNVVQNCTPPSGAPSAGSPTEVAYAHIRSGTSLFDLKKQIERDCIARAMGETDGNITRAATLLGMKRPRLSQLVKQYGLGTGESAEDGESLAAGQAVDDDEV